VPDRAEIFSREIFKFFRELGRNNHKAWMDANRERYKTEVVEPFRVLLDRLSPAVRKLNLGFVTTGRVGENFSRINRDIRFARDKSPYRSQMYLFFAEPGGEAGQLYVGLSAEAVTSGFRVYGGSKSAPLAQLARPRGRANPKWVEGQRRRLAKKYESYWYSTEKGEWTKHKGWPLGPAEWEKLKGWVVRRRFSPSAAALPGFVSVVDHLFRDVYPVFSFVSSTVWNA
jgi:uncharacterized protein (TIGR02453 family)